MERAGSDSEALKFGSQLATLVWSAAEAISRCETAAKIGNNVELRDSTRAMEAIAQEFVGLGSLPVTAWPSYELMLLFENVGLATKIVEYRAKTLLGMNLQDREREMNRLTASVAEFRVCATQLGARLRPKLG